MDPIQLSDLDDQPPQRDFRRANGAPMVRKLDDPTRWDRYSRPSSWGSDLDDESNLVLWRIDRAMEGVAASPALAATVAAAKGRKEGRKELREKAISTGRGEEAADLGTALHAMAERLETEEGFVAPEPYATDLAAYLSCIDAAGLVSSHVEVKVCSDEWRGAGTADRIYVATRELVLPDGSLAAPGTSFIGDLKTGKRLDYSLPGFAIQMAIYCDGCFYDVDTDVRTEFPPTLHTGWGILAHLPAGQGKCELLWADLSVGREGARIVRDVRRWRKRTDYAAPFMMPPTDEIAVLSQPVPERCVCGEQMLSGGTVEVGGVKHRLDGPCHHCDTYGKPVDDDEWTEAMAGWCQTRINLIGTIPDARAILLRRWPENVPPLREGGYTAAHISEILDLIAAIEAAFDLPFPVGDPRPEWNRGLASGDGVQGHQQPSTQEQLNQ